MNRDVSALDLNVTHTLCLISRITIATLTPLVLLDPHWMLVATTYLGLLDKEECKALGQDG